jgi:hypothetical protein
MIREEFWKIEKLGLQIPNLQNISEDRMQIWELDSKEPTLQPGDALVDHGTSRVGGRPWMVADEHIIFQRYAPFFKSENLPSGVISHLVSRLLAVFLRGPAGLHETEPGQPANI